jgi:hypothetical protein
MRFRDGSVYTGAFEAGARHGAGQWVNRAEDPTLV